MKRWKERNGKLYARVTYTDSPGKQREISRPAGSKSDAKEVARQLEHQLKTPGTDPFEHHGALDEYLDK